MYVVITTLAKTQTASLNTGMLTDTAYTHLRNICQHNLYVCAPARSAWKMHVCMKYACRQDQGDDADDIMATRDIMLLWL